MMFVAMLRCRGIDAHAADGIKNLGGGSVAVVVCVAGVITVPAAACRCFGLGRFGSAAAVSLMI